MSDLRERLAGLCVDLPGAEKSDPWGGGHDVWKVGGKLFACIGAVEPGVSLKTQDIETATMLIEAGVGLKAPYFHGSWVRLPDNVAPDELQHRVHASYDIIRAGLTKKAQAALPPRSGSEG